jgi:hypothetical protein
MGIGAVRAGAPKPFQNKTVLIDPSGEVAYSYLKSRPVIGWEESVMQPGDGACPSSQPNLGRVSTAICFEGDHPDFARQAGRGAADLFILPVNDWPAVERIHFHGRLQGHRERNPILRPASFGVRRLRCLRPRAGNDRSRLRWFNDGRRPADRRCFDRLPHVGDLFAWLCLAGTVMAAIVALRLSRKVRSTSDQVPSNPHDGRPLTGRLVGRAFNDLS